MQHVALVLVCPTIGACPHATTCLDRHERTNGSVGVEPVCSVHTQVVWLVSIRRGDDADLSRSVRRQPRHLGVCEASVPRPAVDDVRGNKRAGVATWLGDVVVWLFGWSCGVAVGITLLHPVYTPRMCGRRRRMGNMPSLLNLRRVERHSPHCRRRGVHCTP